jgi:hypothetical protein
MIEKRAQIAQIEEKLSEISTEIVAAQIEIRRGYQAQMRLPKLKLERDKLYEELKNLELQLMTGTTVVFHKR